MLGSSENTLCIAGLSICFQTADLGLTLIGTHTMQQTTQKGNYFMNQERKLFNSLSYPRVLYMIISKFHNIIYRHVTKYLEMAEGN